MAQINKFLSRKLIIHPGLRAWIIYGGNLRALCMERAARFISDEIRRGIEASSKLPSSSHNSRTWKCISSAFSLSNNPPPRSSAACRRNSFMTFDFWHFFLDWAALLRSWLTRVLFTAGNVFFTRFTSNPTSSWRDCAVNGTNVCQKAVSLASIDRLQAKQWQPTPLQAAAHRIWFRRQFFCSHDWNVKSSMVFEQRYSIRRSTVIPSSDDVLLKIYFFVKAKFFSPRKPFFIALRGRRRVQTCLMHSRKVFY